jgi:hypothetical protein
MIKAVVDSIIVIVIIHVVLPRLYLSYDSTFGSKIVVVAIWGIMIL